MEASVTENPVDGLNLDQGQPIGAQQKHTKLPLYRAQQTFCDLKQNHQIMIDKQEQKQIHQIFNRVFERVNRCMWALVGQ